MKALKRIAFAAVLALMGCATQLPAAQDRYKLFFLGGQSNMEGYGFVRELPADWAGPVDRVRIYTANTAPDNESGGGIGIWDRLQPGFGMGFRTNGQVNFLKYRFGPELAFGRRLAELEPGSKIAIIKFARGGFALQAGASRYGTGEPVDTGAGINPYDNALAAIRAALAQRDIDNDGRADQLEPAGIIWMQGESDAYHSQAAADAYEQNLKRMMDLLRAALRVDDLPVVIGKITDSGQDSDGKKMNYIETVQAAQRNFVRSDRCAALVTVTDGLNHLPDGWHYDTDGNLQLGTAFAEAVVRLASVCAAR